MRQKRKKRLQRLRRENAVSNFGIRTREITYALSTDTKVIHTAYCTHPKCKHQYLLWSDGTVRAWVIDPNNYARSKYITITRCVADHPEQRCEFKRTATLWKLIDHANNCQ